jgi:hypothetical protein
MNGSLDHRVYYDYKLRKWALEITITSGRKSATCAVGFNDFRNAINKAAEKIREGQRR